MENEEKKTFMQEFKEFISKGNVLDMAIGVIVGGAFNAIVTSLVTDIITPLIAAIFGAESFSKLVINVGSSQIAIGNFLDTVLRFFITAMSLFVMLKVVTKLQSDSKKALGEISSKFSKKAE